MGMAKEKKRQGNDVKNSEKERYLCLRFKNMKQCFRKENSIMNHVYANGTKHTYRRNIFSVPNRYKQKFFPSDPKTVSTGSLILDFFCN
jgi:hypothetical protein